MLFGIGPDSLKAEMLSRKILLNGVIIDKAHNEYLQIAVTTGILSLIAYLVFIWFVCTSLLKKYIKNVKKKRRLDNDNIMIIAVAASLVSYLVQAFGNISIIGVAPLFWGMLAIGANISKNNE